MKVKYIDEMIEKMEISKARISQFESTVDNKPRYMISFFIYVEGLTKFKLHYNFNNSLTLGRIFNTKIHLFKDFGIKEEDYDYFDNKVADLFYSKIASLEALNEIFEKICLKENYENEISFERDYEESKSAFFFESPYFEKIVVFSHLKRKFEIDYYLESRFKINDELIELSILTMKSDMKKFVESKIRNDKKFRLLIAVNNLDKIV